MGTTRPTPPGVAEILSEYVRLRQQHIKQDEAIAQLKPFAARLNENARSQLLVLIRGWEVRHGGDYEPAESKTAATYDQKRDESDSPVEDEDLSWLPASAGPSSLQQPQPESPPVPQQAPAASAMVLCPSCASSNNATDAHCFACGALLGGAINPDTRQLDMDTVGIEGDGQSHVGQGSTLILQVRGVSEPLVVQLDRLEQTIGRSASDSTVVPDIDLTPFDAANLGVSRAHARLRYEKNTVTITDLGSVNHSYINGQRVHAHEVRVVRDGDEIRLGHLVMHVTFQHHVRRLGNS